MARSTWRQGLVRKSDQERERTIVNLSEPAEAGSVHGGDVRGSFEAPRAETFLLHLLRCERREIIVATLGVKDRRQTLGSVQNPASLLELVSIFTDAISLMHLGSLTGSSVSSLIRGRHPKCVSTTFSTRSTI